MWALSALLLSLALSSLHLSEAVILSTTPQTTTSSLATITLAPRSEYTEAAVYTIPNPRHDGPPWLMAYVSPVPP